jgi:hypothetical protein
MGDSNESDMGRARVHENNIGLGRQALESRRDRKGCGNTRSQRQHAGRSATSTFRRRRASALATGAASIFWRRRESALPAGVASTFRPVPSTFSLILELRRPVPPWLRHPSAQRPAMATAQRKARERRTNQATGDCWAHPVAGWHLTDGTPGP